MKRVSMDDVRHNILEVLRGEMSRQEILDLVQDRMGKFSSHTLERALNAVCDEGILKRAYEDSRKHSGQKYGRA